MDASSPATTPIPLSEDAHGLAALLLVESLIHGLCERGALNAAQAISIVNRAIEVQADYVDASDDPGGSMQRAYSLLTNIGASIETDVNDALPKPRLVE